MQGLGHKQRWTTAVGMALVLLIPVVYIPSHNCLSPQGFWMAPPGGAGHQRSFCTGCVFQWLSWLVLPALAVTALLSCVRFVPVLQTLPLVVRPAASPSSRAPPALA